MEWAEIYEQDVCRQYLIAEYANGKFIQKRSPKGWSGIWREYFKSGKQKLEVPVKKSMIGGTVKCWNRKGVKTSEYREGVFKAGTRDTME